MKRDILSFVLATLLYLGVAFGIYRLSRIEAVASEKMDTTVVTLVARAPSQEKSLVNSEASPEIEENEKEPEPEIEPEPEPKPEPEPSPPIEETPPPPPEEKIPPAVQKPVERIEKIEPKEPTPPKKIEKVQKREKPKKELKKEKKVKKLKKRSVKKRKKRAKKVRKRSKASVHSRASSGGVKNANLCLARIKKRIASKKSYPPRAKRMHIQGTVRVSFTILSGGSVSGVSASGHPLLRASAISAVKRAAPFKIPGCRMRLPRKMSVVLRYRLR
jgi:TonB family protein